MEFSSLVLTRIANHVALRFGVDRKVARKLLPSTAVHWGKIQWLDGGDMMHASSMVTESHRDMSYVKVSRSYFFTDTSGLRYRYPSTPSSKTCTSTNVG